MKRKCATGQRICCVTVGLLASMACALTAQGQTRFELHAPTLSRTSHASLSERELRITDQQGRDTIYTRAPEQDTPDGHFMAYRNASGDQIVRWPQGNSGPMQIGSNTAGRYEYRTSQMQIKPLDAAMANRLPGAVPGAAGPQVLPPGAGPNALAAGLAAGDHTDFFSQIIRQQQPQPRVLRLSIRDDRGRDWFLGKSGGNRLAMHGAANPTVADWHVVPAGRGYVRVMQALGNDWLALAANPNRSLMVEPLGQQANQLWRVIPANNGTGYWLENANMPGLALTGAVDGSVRLTAINNSFGQVWLPQPIATTGYEPLWRTVSHDVRANAPLAPARIELVNSYSSALRILVADRRTNAIREVRIEPSSRVVVPFERDAGASIVETYEVRSASGVWDSQQYVTQIPPAILYDLSVYEEFLQSIAIDRTGTSPNVIEDVNYQPKSIGFLALPPGKLLPDQGQIDAYQDAKAANNPGAVRRYDPKSLEKPSNQPDPLKAILDSVTPQPRQKF